MKSCEAGEAGEAVEVTLAFERCGRCAGTGCRGCFGSGLHIVPAPEVDLRQAIHDALDDYAKAAAAEGSFFEAEVWSKAADIALGFVLRKT